MKERGIQGYSEIVGSEKKNGIRSRDILINKTSKLKMLVTMLGLEISIKNMGMKELGMPESTIKRRQLSTDGYLSRKEGLEKLFIDVEKYKFY